MREPSRTMNNEHLLPQSEFRSIRDIRYVNDELDSAMPLSLPLSYGSARPSERQACGCISESMVDPLLRRFAALSLMGCI